MKIVWVSDGPWVQTGYGCQAALVLPRMRDDGHEVHIVAREMEGSWHPDWEGMPVYGRVAHGYGYDAVPYLFADEPPDVCIFMHDMGPAITSPGEMEAKGFRWIPWFPVDTVNISPVTAGVVRRAWDSATYSRHGEDEAHAAGIPARYIPLALDPAFTPGDRTEARRKVTDGKIPDEDYVVGFVGANQSGLVNRKGLAETLEAFAQIRRERHDVWLYVHTIWKPVDGLEARIDCEEYAHDLGILDRTVFAHPYRIKAGLTSTEDMASIYRAMDMLLAPSITEGFGVPIIEAQACGIPVVTSGWMSMPELVSNGVTIDQDDSDPLWVPGMHAWFRKPHVSAVVNNVKVMLKECRRLRDKDSQLVRDTYGIDAVYENHWKPAIAAWAERIERDR